MGTNYVDFLEEAFRILKDSGKLLIAEVKSRFTPENFVVEMNHLGFNVVTQDTNNSHFIMFEFQKNQKNSSNKLKWPSLKSAPGKALLPCIYKRR